MELRDLIMLLFLTVAKGSSDVRSSLTFVIDDTDSMGEDINQVMHSVNDIFDTVLNSNSTQIEDFIIVTFNDPGTYLRVKTKDREDFKRALSQISVHGGGLCPELAMEGIEMGLNVSREGSLIYVYTDASAKDHVKFARVEALAQKKRSQIVFILTGDCGSRRRENYLVYPNLARATSGQVFRLAKDDIGQIMAYVRKNIENRKHVLTSKAFPPGNGNTFDVTVDGDTRELIIAVSGSHLAVGVTNSEGTRMPTEDITRLSEVLIVNVLGVKPNVYTVGVNSTTDTTVVVSGTTTVHFQHGFSVSEPRSLNDTNVKPFQGFDSYISIKLSSEGGHVSLASVQILDMDEHVLRDIPLNVVDEDEQFYATNETVDLPDHTFLIAIKGYDSESESNLTRSSLTPIKPQLESFSVKAPLISEDGGNKINAAFNEPLQLKCQVTAYPKPVITWVSADSITTFNIGETTTVEFPYVYASVLKIDEVKTNTTFTCLATNNQGSDSRSVAIETKIKFFNILETPSDTTIEHHEQRQIRCEVDAMPPATVYWYKRLRPLIPDGNLEISANATILTINSMEPYLVDNYICEVKNDLNRTVKPFRIDISGFEAPVINKDDDFVLAMRHSPTSITCNVTKGEPRPNITWSYNYDNSTHFHELSETGETIYIDDADVVHAGLYRCLAKNAAGEDHHDIQLSVEFPPTIEPPEYSFIEVPAGEKLFLLLLCRAHGSPKPDITWVFNSRDPAISSKNFMPSNALGALNVSVTGVNQDGFYTCSASNAGGSTNITYTIVVQAFEDYLNPEETYGEIGKPYVLRCPLPFTDPKSVRWFYNSVFMNKTGPSLQWAKGSLANNGNYTCRVSDLSGTATYTVELFFGYPPSASVTEYEDEWNGEQLEITCTANQIPSGKYEWFYKGKKVKEANASELSLEVTGWGQYTCRISNALGTLNITYKFITQDCIIDTNITKTKNMPIVLDKSSAWPSLSKNQHYLVVPHSEKLKLICQNVPPRSNSKQPQALSNSFTKFPSARSIEATCDHEDLFLIDGVSHKISELDCIHPVTPSFVLSGEQCLGVNTQMINIGFYVNDFIKVYSSCLRNMNLPLYTTVTMKGSQNPEDSTSQSACRNVAGCCYETVQLVTADDVSFGAAERTTMKDKLNSVNYCKPNDDTTSWHDIERQVRNGPRMTVWSGAGNYTRVGNMMVPQYLWKVVKDLDSDKTVAVVHSNAQALIPKLCAVDCGSSSVLSLFEPRGVRTYCCSLNEFKTAFNLHIPF